MRLCATVWEIGTRDFVNNDEGRIMVCDPFYGSSNTLNPVGSARWVDAQLNVVWMMLLLHLLLLLLWLLHCHANLCLSHDDDSLSSFFCGVYNGSAYLADDYDTNHTCN
eukprot:433506_1